jgi:undecaprenyl diphosphate synthase
MRADGSRGPDGEARRHPADPRHIAIIMDGNGRWAQQRVLPRMAGHKRGVEAVRAVVRSCRERGIEFLSLFAFSSENWQRPADEISFLMELFALALKDEVTRLHAQGIRFRVVGDRDRFEQRLVDLIGEAERLTRDNAGLTLTIAANYGGRWDLVQAVNRMLKQRPQAAGAISEADLVPYLALSYAPEPDLFIRTGGEQRISNFLLWQLAYTELYFTDTLWPDFDGAAFDHALEAYRRRERRFGRIPDDETKISAAAANRCATG